jgi:hypothetical protein
MMRPGTLKRRSFRTARENALEEYDDEGYTGSIAEKESFVMIPLPLGEDAEAYARRICRERDPRVRDKRGPAGCIEVQVGEYLFFGWASD